MWRFEQFALQFVRPFSSMLAWMYGMAEGLMSLAVTSEPGTSLAILTDLDPVAHIASATVNDSRSRDLRSMTLTSLLNAICSLKNTDPTFLPGPWTECSRGTRMSVLPSLMTVPSGVTRSPRSSDGRSCRAGCSCWWA